MSKRELLLAACLLIALGLIVVGVGAWSHPTALIVAGLGIGALAVLFFIEVG